MYDDANRPRTIKTGDCTIRATAILLGLPWADVATWDGFSVTGSSARTFVGRREMETGWLRELKRRFWVECHHYWGGQPIDEVVRSVGPNCLVTPVSGGHVAAVRDGVLRDTHDWRNERVKEAMTVKPLRLLNVNLDAAGLGWGAGARLDARAPRPFFGAAVRLIVTILAFLAGAYIGATVGGVPISDLIDFALFGELPATMREAEERPRPWPRNVPYPETAGGVLATYRKLEAEAVTDADRTNLRQWLDFCHYRAEAARLEGRSP